MNTKKYLKAKMLFDDANAIIIGSGSGLSTSAGYTYSKERFHKYFQDFITKYNFKDMYTAGFYDFPTEGEYWAYWSRYIYINRYMDIPKSTYTRLYNLVKDKNYFILTTNVDHCFQRSSFNKERIFYMQGDYGLFQCPNSCDNKTYDNEAIIKKMLLSQNIKITSDKELIMNDNVKMTIDSNLIPKCPVCGRKMIVNLRSDDKFLEDDTWHYHKTLYENFLNENKNKKVLFLELGVGFNTPGIIRYPFENMTYYFKGANLVRVNKDYPSVPLDIKNKSLEFNCDAFEFLKRLESTKKN